MTVVSRPPSTPPPPSVAGRRTTKSAEQAARAQELIAAPRAQALPVHVRAGEGAEIVDVDGNRYVDFFLAGGTAIVGHAHPGIVEAVRAAAQDGAASAYPHGRELQVAEQLLSHRTGYDRVRFCAGSTEALQTALALARAATGRAAVVHVSRRAQRAPDVLAVTSGDVHAVESALAAEGPRIAAVVVEAASVRAGVHVIAKASLEAMKAATARAGALFVIDEGPTSLRFADPGVTSDMRLVGPTLGGGWPLGALLIGRSLANALQDIESAPPSASALAAARVVLDEFASGLARDRLNALGAQLDEGLKAAQARIPWLRWAREGSLFWLCPEDAPLPAAGEGVRPVALHRITHLQARLLDRGILLPPHPEQAAALSTAHTPEHIGRIVEALEVECEKLAHAEASAA